MHSSKFIYLLRSLNEDELKQFKKFIISPFFNSNKNVIKAFSIISKDYPDFDSPKISRENIFKAVYGNKKYIDGNVRYLSSELLKLGEEFLEIYNMKKEPLSGKKFLLNELHTRGLNKLFDINYKYLKSFFEKWDIKDSGYLKCKYEIDHEVSIYNSSNKEYLLSVTEDKFKALVEYVSVELLTKYRFLLNQNNYVYTQEIELPFLNELLSYVKEKSFFGLPVIKVLYLEIMTLLSPEDESCFFDLKTVLKRDFDILNYSEQYNGYVLMLNYCYKKSAEGNKKFDKEAFLINRESVEKNILFKSNVISPSKFENIVKDSLKMNEYDWAESFIYKYSHMLRDEERDHVVGYCHALIYYSKGMPEKAVSFLSNRSQANNILNYRARNLAIKVYYELGYFDLIYSMIDSYRHFLSKNKNTLTVDAYESNSSLVKFLPSILKAREIYDEKRVTDLREKVSSIGRMGEKEWVMEKIREMESVIKRKKVNL